MILAGVEFRRRVKTFFFGTPLLLLARPSSCIDTHHSPDGGGAILIAVDGFDGGVVQPHNPVHCGGGIVNRVQPVQLPGDVPLQTHSQAEASN